MLLRTVLLVMSFSALTYLVGCTALGYVVGDAIDQHHAKTVAIDLAADSCACEKGDRVVLILASGDSLSGTVKKITPGQSLTLITHPAEPIAYKPAQIEDIPWADIHSVAVIQKPVTWRIILATTGILIDVTVYSFLKVISSLGGAFASMGA